MQRPRIALLDTAIAKVPPRTTEPFYGSAAWKALRAEVLRERGPTCQKCGRVDGRPFCDHIVEISDGGAPLDRRNIQVLCGSCHTAKTNAVARARPMR